jgi:peptidylprolyl isomerase
MAECQPLISRLMHRYREQAPSHIWFCAISTRCLFLHLPNPADSGKTPAFHASNETPMSNDELQVTDIRLGTGKTVVKGALITTQYTGTLEDGTVFDSSWERGKPFQCVIGTGRVIKGWDQGLMGMQVGGVRTLYVPAHLAYGERSMGAHIKPNSNLRFEIELLEVLTRDD